MYTIVTVLSYRQHRESSHPTLSKVSQLLPKFIHRGDLDQIGYLPGTPSDLATFYPRSCTSRAATWNDVVRSLLPRGADLPESIGKTGKSPHNMGPRWAEKVDIVFTTISFQVLRMSQPYTWSLVFDIIRTIRNKPLGSSYCQYGHDKMAYIKLTKTPDSILSQQVPFPIQTATLINQEY